MDFKFPLTLDSAGRPETVDAVAETAQRCRVVLKSGQGEWDFDLSYGVPWIAILGSRPFDLGAARGAMVQQLKRVPGVDSVKSLTLTPDYSTRTLSVAGEVVASGVTIEITA